MPSSSSSQITLSYTKTTPIKKANTLKEFRAVVSKNDEPVVYAIPKDQQFPAFSKWDYSFFASSRLEVGVRRCTSDRFFDFRNSSVLELARSALLHQAELGDYVRKILNQSQQDKEYNELISGIDLRIRHHYTDWPEFQDFLPDVAPLPDMFLPERYTKEDIDVIGIWISGGGISSQMHFDRNGHNNLNFQLRGTKLFTLFEPTDGRKHVYPLPSRLHNFSLVDPYEPGIETKFPRLADSKPYVVELQEGEVLFIPAMWWHDIRHIGKLNVNVTCWYTSLHSGENPWKWPCFGETWYDTIQAWYYAGKFVAVVVIAMAMKLGKKIAARIRSTCCCCCAEEHQKQKMQ